jgi:hypothetical protein
MNLTGNSESDQTSSSDVTGDQPPKPKTDQVESVSPNCAFGPLIVTFALIIYSAVSFVSDGINSAPKRKTGDKQSSTTRNSVETPREKRDRIVAEINREDAAEKSSQIANTVQQIGQLILFCGMLIGSRKSLKMMRKTGTGQLAMPLAIFSFIAVLFLITNFIAMIVSPGYDFYRNAVSWFPFGFGLFPIIFFVSFSLYLVHLRLLAQFVEIKTISVGGTIVLITACLIVIYAMYTFVLIMVGTTHSGPNIQRDFQFIQETMQESKTIYRILVISLMLELAWLSASLIAPLQAKLSSVKAASENPPVVAE